MNNQNIYNIFNPDYFNQDYIRQQQELQFHNGQQAEIVRMVKAIDDFFDACRKVAPQYIEQAQWVSINEIWRQMQKDQFKY